MGSRFLVLALSLWGLSGCAAGFRAEARGRVVTADDGYPLRVYEMVESGTPRAPARDGLVFYLDGSRRSSVLERMGGRSALPCAEIDVVRWLERTRAISAEDARVFAERTRHAHPEWFAGGRERCAL